MIEDTFKLIKSVNVEMLGKICKSILRVTAGKAQQSHPNVIARNGVT